MEYESLRNYRRQNNIKDYIEGHQGNPGRGYLDCTKMKRNRTEQELIFQNLNSL
jgi:hypothetical protein